MTIKIHDGEILGILKEVVNSSSDYRTLICFLIDFISGNTPLSIPVLTLINSNQRHLLSCIVPKILCLIVYYLLHFGIQNDRYIS